jgi:uncharacterized protein (TIGR03435 family)
MTRKLALIALGLAQILSAQKFDVASVRPSPPADPTNTSRVDVGVHINKDQVRINALSLKDYVAWAYRVKTYQVSGPDWMNDRFDVNATMAAGSNSEQLPEMMKALLEERFGLKVHKTQKEFPVYVLERGKKPLTLTKVELGPAEEGGVTVGGSGSRDGIAVNMGRGASYTFADNKLIGKKLDMTTAVDVLANFLDLPVVNQTKLEGNYDFELPLSADDYRTMLIRAGQKAGVPLPPQALKLLEGASIASLYDAIDNAGLKMESRKEPLDVINVDEIKRQPTEN